MSHGSRARILLVDDVSMEAKLLLRTLADAGYSNVVYKSDVQSALAEFDASKPRIIITDYELGGQNGLDLTKKVRQSNHDDYTYVLMLTGHGGGQKLAAAFEGGVDDFVTKPYRPEELLARVRAAVRVVDLETRLRRRSAELEMALRRIDVGAAQRALAMADAEFEREVAEPAGSVEGIATTATWTTLGETYAKVISDFFQTPFAVGPTGVVTGTPYIGSITLTDPSREIELHISVLVDIPTRNMLAERLFGENDEEAAKALVLEVANTLMGAVKTKLNAAGYTFVAGLAQEITIERARKEVESTPIRLRATLASSDASLHVWTRAISKGNSRVRVRMLRDGMVLSNDVKTHAGMLLLRGGSRLTQSAIDRLVKMDPELEVEVSLASVA